MDTPPDQTLPGGPVVTDETRRAEPKGKEALGEMAAGGAGTEATGVEGVIFDTVMSSHSSKDDSLPAPRRSAPRRNPSHRRIGGGPRTRRRRRGQDSRASSTMPGRSPPRTAGNGSGGMPRVGRINTRGRSTKLSNAPKSFERSCSSSRMNRRGGRAQGEEASRRTTPQSRKEGQSRAR